MACDENHAARALVQSVYTLLSSLDKPNNDMMRAMQTNTNMTNAIKTKEKENEINIIKNDKVLTSKAHQWIQRSCAGGAGAETLNN